MMFKEFRETEDFKLADVITFVGTDGGELDIDNPDSEDLDNFESYLSYHFDVWMEKWANSPE